MPTQKQQSSNSFRSLPDTHKPREKMRLTGASNLSLTELVAILLQTGSNEQSVLELAQDIAQDGLQKMLGLTEEEICSFQGVGQSKASSLLAAFELAKRFGQETELVSLNKPSKVFYQLFDIKDRKQEVCQALYVNGSRQLLEKKTLSIGSLNQNFLEFRELLGPAITLPASGFFLAHNHPSQNCQPSQQDVAVTTQIAKGANLIGVELIDHIIVSRNSYFSFKQQGLLS